VVKGFEGHDVLPANGKIKAKIIHGFRPGSPFQQMAVLFNLSVESVRQNKPEFCLHS
jgi:hypothetical protein